MNNEKEKSNFHPRSKHNKRYDFPELIETSPELADFVQENKYGNLSIDFFNRHAVKALNGALLKHYYGLSYWDIPKGYLCPAVPGRADYVHYVADLLGSENMGKPRIRCLDIGVGANSIYPIIAVNEYNWDLVATEVDPIALKSAQKIVSSNPSLKNKVELRLQRNQSSIFEGVIKKKERFDLVISNPPFHSSQEEARDASSRKQRNLKGGKKTKLTLNFEGQSNELWTQGGEFQFVSKMIEESYTYRHAISWCTSLLSKEKNIKKLLNKLDSLKKNDHKIIEMGTANKKTRILAWKWSDN